MSSAEGRHGHHRPWSQRSAGSKALVIAAIVVGVPGLVALFGAITMWLWDWLMPSIFGLPRIGFWEALGILVLAQILFKGGHARHGARGYWKRRQIWKHMREDEPEGRSATV
jgi:hypothetical protein